MSKAKYVILNYQTHIGTLWENKKLGKIFVSTGEKIDPNFDLEVYDCESDQRIGNVDLKDFLLETLSHI
jgi:hypothetical protein